jgi:phosphatidylinositol alpha-1,6-mannosyltransferase
MIGRSELRTVAPPGQLIRFWGQAANYDRFLTAEPADLVHVHRAYHRQFLCQEVVGLSVPLVVTVHSVNPLLQSNPAWMRSMITGNYRRARHLIAVSNFVRDKIVGYGARPEATTVIHNGVDLSVFTPEPPAPAREELGLPQDRFLFLFSGNLIARKGVAVLVRAFCQLVGRQPEAHLVIIGTGEQEAALRTLTAQFEITDQVTFAGYRPFAEMPKWYQACDVFVMPSWAEGLSMAILEAMASGRPVVSTRPETGDHDAVYPEETGLLTDYGDIEQLALALERLCSEPGLSQDLGRNARRLAEEKFSWQRIGQKTADFYRCVLDQPHHPEG